MLGFKLNHVSKSVPRSQAVYWSSVNKDLCRQMASLGHNILSIKSIKSTTKYEISTLWWISMSHGHHISIDHNTWRRNAQDFFHDKKMKHMIMYLLSWDPIWWRTGDWWVNIFQLIAWYTFSSFTVHSNELPEHGFRAAPSLVHCSNTAIARPACHI